MIKKIIKWSILSLILLISYTHAVTDTYPYHMRLQSEHDSVFYTLSVLDGATIALVEIHDDTILTGDFPYDTTFVLQSDSAYSILFQWFINDVETATIENIPRKIDTLIHNTEIAADTSASGPWASTDDIVTGILAITVTDTTTGSLFSFWTRYINEIKSDIDTSLILGGYVPGAFSYQYRSVDIDTLVLGVGTDTLIDIIYYHIGGTSGAAPDSTRVQVHP